MEIKTTYEIGNVVYVIYNNAAYKGEVLDIDIEVGKEGVNIDYYINIEKPIGLLKKEYEEKYYSQESIYSSLGEIEEYLKDIENKRKEIRDFDLNNQSTSGNLTSGYLAALRYGLTL